MEEQGIAINASEARFEAYVRLLSGAVKHADRVAPLRAYCKGLLMPDVRKSVEPMAAILAPTRTRSMHQSMHHFVADSTWQDEMVHAVVRDHVLPAIEAHGPITAWIVDDTGFPKKGMHSVGVARQYCGQLGKTDNCQVAVSLSVANEHASLPVAYQLYLPKKWANDAVLRKKGGVPEHIRFQTKPQIALGQIRTAFEQGISPGVVLGDTAYGNHTAFRDGVTEVGLPYVLEVVSTTTVWAPGTEPRPPEPQGGRGRPAKLLRRSRQNKPVSVQAMAASLPAKRWKTITWREGSDKLLSSRFAVCRVRPAHRDYDRHEPRPEELLLIEWPPEETEPTKYWLSTLPKGTSVRQLVAAAKQRWRIERDYRELKQEVGLGHYEGRGWRGFHHHATLCIAAYGFLITEKDSIPPSGPGCAAMFKETTLPDGYRPRGSPTPNGTPRAKFNSHPEKTNRRRNRNPTTPMSMLPAANSGHGQPI